jgi:hypothetical protein
MKLTIHPAFLGYHDYGNHPITGLSRDLWACHEEQLGIKPVKGQKHTYLYVYKL